MAINISDLLKTVSNVVNINNEHTLYSTDDIYVKTKDIILKLHSPKLAENLSSALYDVDVDHDVTMCVNFEQMLIHPFVMKNCDQFSQIIQLVQHNLSKYTSVNYKPKFSSHGDYLICFDIKVTAFGWFFFMLKNFEQLVLNIPLPKHRNLGNVKLFFLKNETSERNIFDIELKIIDQNNKDIFINSDIDATHDDLTKLVTFTHGKTTSSLVYGKKLILQNEYQDVFKFIKQEIFTYQNITSFNEYFKLDANAIKYMDDVEDVVSINSTETQIPMKACFVDKQGFSIYKQQLIKHLETLLSDFETMLKDEINVLTNEWNDVVGPYAKTARFMVNSEFDCFDYLLAYIFQKLQKVHVICENSEHKLFLNLVVKILFTASDIAIDASKTIKNYLDLDYKLFGLFCDSFKFISDHSLSSFFALKINCYIKHQNWNLSDYIVKQLDNNFKLAYDGWFVVYKTEDSVYCFSERYFKQATKSKSHDDCSKIAFKSTKVSTLPDICFNNSKFVYVTEHGVYNTVTNKFFDFAPFVIANTMFMCAPERKQIYNLPKHFFDDIMNNGDVETLALELYHAAHVSRKMRRICALSRLAMYIGNDIITNENIEHIVKIFNHVYLYSTTCLLAIIKFAAPQLTNLLSRDDIKLSDVTLQLLVKYALCSAHSDILFLIIYLSDDNDDKFVRDLGERVSNISTKLLITRRDDVMTNLRKFTQVSHIGKLIKNICNDTLLSKDVLLAQNRIDPSRKKFKSNTIHPKQEFAKIKKFLGIYNVWKDKLLLPAHNETTLKWLIRFYMRCVFTRIPGFVEYATNPHMLHVARAYCYMLIANNFAYDHVWFLLMFGASLNIPQNYEKLIVTLTGSSNAGKTSFVQVLGKIAVKMPANNFIDHRGNGPTEMEFSRAICQLYEINEVHKTTAEKIKNIADLSKEVVVRHAHSSCQKITSQYKPLICNNRMLEIENFDKAVENRLIIVYYDHVFVKKVKFDGSIYDHFIAKQYPDEPIDIIESFKILISYILMYYKDVKTNHIFARNKVSPRMKNNVKAVAIVNMCADAIDYVLNVQSTDNPDLWISVENLKNIMIHVSSTITNILISPKIVSLAECEKIFHSRHVDKYYENTDGDGFYRLSIETNPEIIKHKKTPHFI
ncbi:helicase [Neodiprion lecontei nucleopolyhedrovirus]|uniref:Helicase n=1 Tax=Neodiprion lecontei nucleopolyhedrovirus (strain Canada) TaxID=654906 RepID=Q6JPB0_NPVNC|nr:helicase [Neodiprion lecontei nucleopolyhedrovirus]AAQ99063.1 helicase [Neodiprion lecontei nucleopolyhedrovirus]